MQDSQSDRHKTRSRPPSLKLWRASASSNAQCKSCEARRAKQDGGEGWIRTSVRLRGQIYSLLPLTTRPPLQVQAGAPNGGAGAGCQRVKSLVAPRACARVRSNFQQSPGLSKIGAGEGNRTLVVSLEGFCSTIELHPLAPERTCRCHWPRARVNQLGARLTGGKSLDYQHSR